MDDVLLSYYNRELNYIRKAGAEFSEKYPKIAGRLRLDKEVVEDPHVSRLIESFAFLTARIRHSLDDSFPELTEALMGVLYPDYHAPLPSMTILELSLMPHLQKKVTVPRGKKFKVKGYDESYCYYKACTAADVLPVSVEKIKFYPLPAKAPSLPVSIQKTKSVQSILKIKLKPTDESGLFNFDEDKLRFYINAPTNIAFNLHQVLLNNVVGVAIARDAFDEDPFFYDSGVVAACGFSADESILDFDGRASSAHRLLAEYFLLPQKFLFVELDRLSGAWSRYKEGFEIYIYCDTTNTDLVRGVDAKTFMLGCVPIVNMFESACEPLQASELGSEVMLRVSSQDVKLADIYQIKEVYATNHKGERKVIPPFYGGFSVKGPDQIYWSYRRENSQWQKGKVSHGTDVYLNFVDFNFKTIAPQSDWIINVDVVCTNRDQPNNLPFGPNQPGVSFGSGGAGLRISCLVPPTPTVLPKLSDSTRWQLVSQLSLQHFSDSNGLDKLKETLTLYNFNDSKEARSLIDGIVSLETELVTARILDSGRSAMCQGTHFIITCDENFYAGNGLYLFGSILDEFFSQFSVINTFTQLSIKTTRYSRIEFSWPPRVGCQPLV